MDPSADKEEHRSQFNRIWENQATSNHKLINRATLESIKANLSTGAKVSNSLKKRINRRKLRLFPFEGQSVVVEPVGEDDNVDENGLDHN